MPSEKILIVDDERLVRWSLRQKCEEWGYHVSEAEAGEPGLKMAQHESPDLVLLDVRMPDISGLEVLDQLKKNGDARAVIMITADPQLDDVKAALKLGAYDFVGKPLDFEELHVTIKNALETTRLRTEVQSLRGEVHRRTGYHNVVGVSRQDDRVDELRPQSRRQRGDHHPDSGRKRNRQRPDRQGDPLREHARRKSLSSPSTARPSRKRSWRPNSSATKRARSPTPSR